LPKELPIFDVSQTNNYKTWNTGSISFLFQFDQTSLGLPSRDYYLQPSYVPYLEAYKNYLIKIAKLLGAPLDDATQQAEELIDFEIRLARVRHHKHIF
jgi:predicted metalloendopeptidase